MASISCAAITTTFPPSIPEAALTPVYPSLMPYNNGSSLSISASVAVTTDFRRFRLMPMSAREAAVPRIPAGNPRRQPSSRWLPV
ncbi:hypothetical protein AHAS_Ahas09G0204900 [Arachis hypogaea]